MRLRPDRVPVMVLALAGLLPLSPCSRAQGQDDKPPVKKAAVAAVEKDVPYADGGEQRILDLYLPGKMGFTTIVFT